LWDIKDSEGYIYVQSLSKIALEIDSFGIEKGGLFFCLLFITQSQ